MASRPGRILRTGRGLRRGPDAYVNQQEAFLQQRELNLKQNGWALGPLGEALLCATDDILIPSGESGFLPLPQLSRIYHLTHVQVYSDGGGGAHLHVALYTWKRSPASFRIVKNSQCTVSVGTGLITKALSNVCIVEDSEKYFLAWYNHSGGPMSIAGIKTNPKGIPVNIHTHPVLSGEELHETVYLRETTVSSTQSVPFVVYLSTEATEVL
jgi:hypothetical protein